MCRSSASSTEIASHTRDNLSVLPAQTYCEEWNRLLDEYLVVVADYLRIESTKLAAAVRGDEFLSDAELDAARKRTDVAREAIKSHVQEHGC